MQRSKNIGSTEACAVCEIVSGRAPSVKVFEDEEVFAFLDRSPVFKGHTLFVPKKHYANLYDMEDGSMPRFFGDLKLVSKGLRHIGAKAHMARRFGIGACQPLSLSSK